MKRAILTTVGALLAVTPLSAQIDFAVELDGTTAAIPSTNTGVEFDGVAVRSDASIFYIFDSEGGADHLLRWTGSGSPTVFATEAQLDAVGGTNASWNDQDVDDANVLYLLLAGNTFQEICYRVPGDDFTNAVQMIADPDVDEASEIEVDEKNSRLIVAYNDAFSTPGPAFGEGLGFVPLNATNASITEIASEAQIETTMSGMTGYVDDVTNDLGIMDMAVQSDGDIVFSHSFAASDQLAGSLFIVDENGTNVNVFASADDIITAAGGTPASDDIGNVRVEALTMDEILIHVVFTSGTLEPFIGVFQPDGTGFQMLATESAVYADSDLTSLGVSSFNMDGKNGDVDGNDVYYFYHQGITNTDSAVIRMDGIRAFLTTSSVGNWSVYN